jgi:hypothetical protein
MSDKFTASAEIESKILQPILDSSPNILTGGYHVEETTTTKTFIIYANTRDKEPRRNAVNSFENVISQNQGSFDQSKFGDFQYRVTLGESGTYNTGYVDIVVYKIVKEKETQKRTLRFTIKPAQGARASIDPTLAQECLQVVACSLRQALNKVITRDDFLNFLNYAVEVVRRTRIQNDRDQRTLYRKVIVAMDLGDAPSDAVYSFGLNNDDWITSSVTIANKLTQLYSSNDYFFCHSSSRYVDWYWDGFKRARTQILRNRNLFAGFSANDLDRNKWNPADIFAMKKNMRTRVITFPGISTTQYSTSNEVTLRDIKNSLKKTGRTRSATVNIGGQIINRAKNSSTVNDLPSLNYFLYDLSKTRKFYPISLKKVGTTCNLQKISGGVGTPIVMTASLEYVDWKNISSRGGGTTKVQIHFNVRVGNKRPKSYYIVARQFNARSNIKFQIEVEGGTAFHGKAGMKISELIISMTDSSVVQSMRRVRSETKKLHPQFVEATSVFTDYSDLQRNWRNGDGIPALRDYAARLSNNQVTQFKEGLDSYASKIQASEFGYIMESNNSSGITSKILYSMYNYAGSRGLTIINGDEYKTYFASSFHVKVL